MWKITCNLYKLQNRLYQKRLVIDSKMMFDLAMKFEKNHRIAPKRTGGSKARHADQTMRATKPYLGPLARGAKNAHLMNESMLELVEDQALSILENLGFDFGHDENVLALLSGAGAELRNGRVHLPKAMCKKLLKHAPETFTHHGRNRKYSVEIGGEISVFTPPSGAGFVWDLNGKRRQSTQNDLENFVKLAQFSPSLHATGFTPCQATDIDRDERYLDALYAHIKYSDKPFSGATGSSMEALHCVEMARIVFGERFLADHHVLLAELSVASPLKFDQNTLDVLQVYAASNQAIIMSSMALLGVTSPMSIFGALVQVTAEFLAGAAFAQIIKPGSPVVFGVFSAVASMQFGTLSFSSPQGVQFMQCAGQMAQKLGVPFRTSGGTTGAKTLDSQAIFESWNGLTSSISSGANIVSNCAGSLEGGMAVSFEKFVTDIDQLGLLQADFLNIQDDDIKNAEDAILDGIGSGSFLASAYTKDNFGNFDVGSNLADNNIFEQWRADGGKSAEDRAGETCRIWLENYQMPPLDPEIDHALREFIKVKRTMVKQLPKTRMNRFLEAQCQAIAADHLHDNMWGDVFKRFERK